MNSQNNNTVTAEQAQERINMAYEMLKLNEKELLNHKLQLEVAKLREEIANYSFHNAISMYTHMSTMYHENEAGRLIYEGYQDPEERAKMSNHLLKNCKMILDTFKNEKSDSINSNSNPQT
jgi:hypothetical protein